MATKRTQSSETIIYGNTPILIPGNHVRSWDDAHEDLIATTTTTPQWSFIILKTGEYLYGYSGDSDFPLWDRYEFAAHFAQHNPEWAEAIKDIPSLWQYHQAHLDSKKH